MAQERRRFQRVGLDTPVRVLLEESENGFLLDLCEGGIAVCELGPRAPGQVVPFQFDLPEGSGRVEGKAQIIWKSASGHRTGLHFVEMADPCRERLVHWIAGQAWTMRLDGVESERREPARAGLRRAAEVPASPLLAKPSDEEDRNWMLASAEPPVNASLESKNPPPVNGEALWNDLASDAKSSRAVGVALVAVLLSVTLGFLLYHSHGTRASARAKDNPIPAAPVPPPATLDSPAAAAAPAPSKPGEPSIPAAPNHIQGAGVVVQVGAMTHEAYANALVKDLKQKNLPAFVFHRGGDNFYRVAVGPFTDGDSPSKVKGELERQGFKPFLRPWAPSQQ